MNVRGLLYIVTLASGFTTISAQFDMMNATRDAFDGLTEKMQAVECDDGTRADAQCNLTPFSGTFVCREFGSLFGEPVLHTVCARNIVEGLTVGLENDSCGCCPDENGERSCPTACPCACEEGHVSVDVHILGFIKFSRCVTNGWSRHATAWGNAVKCTENCENVGN